MNSEYCGGKPLQLYHKHIFHKALWKKCISVIFPSNDWWFSFPCDFSLSLRKLRACGGWNLVIKQRRVSLFDSIIIASAAQMSAGRHRTCFCFTSSQVHSKRRLVGECGENRRASQRELRKTRITSWTVFNHSAIPHCLTWQRDSARGRKAGERMRCEHMWGFCGFLFWDGPWWMGFNILHK